jgi:hypothetical protein
VKKKPGPVPPSNLARDRKDAAEAALKELQLEQRRGELLERAKVERQVFELARQERDAWTTWTVQAAPRLASELGVAERETFTALDALVREHLASLSELAFPAGNDGGQNDGDDIDA